MNYKSFRLSVSLLLIAFACISIGGCGGNSSSFHENESKAVNGTVIIDNELAEDEIPAILEFEGITEKSYARDSVISGEIISVPSRNYLTRLKGVRSHDSFVMNLTKGTEYTVEISKGDYYQHEIGYNVPDIEIVNPIGNSLDFLDIGESADVRAIHSLSDDVIELSVYPDENPYMICLTFTPAETGSYTINLCQSVSDDIVEDEITLFVYEELRNDDDSTAGYYRRYKFADKDGNLSSTVNMSDIMALRNAWNNAAEDVIEMWNVISDDETLTYEELEEAVTEIPSVQAYLDCVSMVKQYYGIFDDYKELDEYSELNDYETAARNTEEVMTAANTGGTKIPAEIYGIPYDESQFTLGNGFFAITGAPAQGYALRRQSLVFNVPANVQRKALFKAGFISSQQDAENFATTTLDKAVQLGGFGYSTVYSHSHYCRFGLTSTTFVIHHEETEPVYRMLDDDEDYKLDDEAKDILQQDGSSAFRNEFGDYFVGGYQYGVTYDAFISITTRTNEQLDRVKARLPELFSSEEKAEDPNVAKEAEAFLRNNDATLNIKIKISGVTNRIYSTSAMGSVASSLSYCIEEAKKLRPSELVPVYVMLKRYRLLPDVFAKMKQEGDNGLAPIPSAHSQKVMNFKRDMVTMHSYFNAISGLNNISQEVKNGYWRRYYDIKSTIDRQIRTFFNESNAANMQKMHDDMLKLTSELKNLGDRYAFYQLLVNAQAEEKRRNDNNGLLDRPYGSSGGSIGYQSFMSSAVVQSDINAGRDFEEEKNTFSGSEWKPHFDAGDGYVFCHIKVTANNVHDRERRAIPPNIGHQRADFSFRCGASRWLEWKINLRSMRLNSNLYPFSGLE